MINTIISGVIKLIISLVSIILAPIDLLITNALPSLSGVLDSISGFLNICTSGIGWVISLTGLSSEVISIIITYFVFKLSAPMLFYMIKLAIAWYNKLKL